MKQIYFIRHAESEQNVDKNHRGENALTNRGFEQTRILAERLKEIPIDLVIVTSKKRSKQTTEILNLSLQAPLKESDLFTEQEEKFEKMDPSAERTESFVNLCKRAQEAISFLENLSEDKIAIVTHGRFLKFLTAYIILKQNLN
jgi:broad specificity phosphatase PhoE